LDKLETAVSSLIIEWLNVSADSPIAGKNIGELGLRKNHGIIVIAVMEDRGKGHKETIHINPGPSYVFQPGHIVVTAGRTEKIKEFKKMFGEKT